MCKGMVSDNKYSREREERERECVCVCMYVCVCARDSKDEGKLSGTLINMKDLSVSHHSHLTQGGHGSA